MKAAVDFPLLMIRKLMGDPNHLARIAKEAERCQKMLNFFPQGQLDAVTRMAEQANRYLKKIEEAQAKERREVMRSIESTKSLAQTGRQMAKLQDDSARWMEAMRKKAAQKSWEKRERIGFK